MCPLSDDPEPDITEHDVSAELEAEPDLTDAQEAAAAKKRAERLRDKLRKRRERQLQREEKAKIIDRRGRADLDPVPHGLVAMTEWVRTQQDKRSQGTLTDEQMQQVHRTAATIANLERARSDRRKADAALISAEAQRRMADSLARLEHGEHAVVLLQRLQESLTDGGPRRPLPRPRTITITPAGREAQ